MTLPWLAHYLFQNVFQLVLLALGVAICLSGVLFLLDALCGGKRVSAGGSVLGIVSGALWAATALLEGDPRRHHLGAALLDAGMLPLMLYAAQFTRRRKAEAPGPVPHPDSVWPPPPTSQDGNGTMIPRWLAGYPLGDLMQIAAGVLMCLGSGISLLEKWQGKDRLPMSAILVGFLWGACYTVASVLHMKPQWVSLSHVLTLAGSVFAIIWCVLINRHNKRNRVAVQAQPQYAAPSDDIWPPPPTSPGGSKP